MSVKKLGLLVVLVLAFASNPLPAKCVTCPDSLAAGECEWGADCWEVCYTILYQNWEPSECAVGEAECDQICRCQIIPLPIE